VYGFLLSRRWVLLAMAVLLLTTLSVRLGFWQLSRLEERLADNEVTAQNLAVDPVPVSSLAGSGDTVAEADEWRPVTATGTYDTTQQLLVRYQTRGEERGVDVLTPLVVADGTAVLVDRGFVESPAGTPDTADVPAPPAGKVTVTGWLRRDSDAPSAATAASGGTVRAVSSAALAPSLPYPVTAGWVLATEEDPPPAQQLAGPEAPELDSGPHFFYAMQWFFFALLALTGYGYFAWDEAHPARRRSDVAPGDGVPADRLPAGGL
jgi:cytochrome oxidase assembly protein ShyY1